MKKVVFLWMAILAMAGCSQQKEYVGSYTGTIPCADCQGIQVDITLKADNTYEKAVVYLGKGDGEAIKTSGTYSVDAQGTLTLDGISGEPNKYTVGKNTLTQLDMNGEPITGSLSANYVLRKK